MQTHWGGGISGERESRGKTREKTQDGGDCVFGPISMRMLGTSTLVEEQETGRVLPGQEGVGPDVCALKPE